jgi:hypothetical protein
MSSSRTKASLNVSWLFSWIVRRRRSSPELRPATGRRKAAAAASGEGGFKFGMIVTRTPAVFASRKGVTSHQGVFLRAPIRRRLCGWRDSMELSVASCIARSCWDPFQRAACSAWQGAHWARPTYCGSASAAPARQGHRQVADKRTGMIGRIMARGCVVKGARPHLGPLIGEPMVQAATDQWAWVVSNCVSSRAPKILPPRHYPGAATGCALRSLPQPCQPSPHGCTGQPAHCPFRGLLSVHSRYGLHTRQVA